jgi:mRNA interferase MazF
MRQTRSGRMHNPGDVVLAKIQFTDSAEIKRRPCLILYSEYDNYVVAGITSNKNMDGIRITVKDGAIKDSVIKTNYVFSITNHMIDKKLFTLGMKKRKEVYDRLIRNLSLLAKE